MSMSFPSPKAQDTDPERGPNKDGGPGTVIRVHLLTNSSPSKKLQLTRSRSLPEYLGNRIVRRGTSKVLKERLEIIPCHSCSVPPSGTHYLLCKPDYTGGFLSVM